MRKSWQEWSGRGDLDPGHLRPERGAVEDSLSVIVGQPLHVCRMRHTGSVPRDKRHLAEADGECYNAPPIICRRSLP